VAVRIVQKDLRPFPPLRLHQGVGFAPRRGIRDEISRYEAMSIALVEPKGTNAGTVFPAFPPPESPLLLKDFFKTPYQRYEERFVYLRYYGPENAADANDPELPSITRCYAACFPSISQ
jgi:hypothetical protein